MKCFLYLLILLTIGSSVKLNACELYWYLAASLSKPGKEIVRNYNQRPGVCNVYLVVGGSGQLLSQLQMAKKGDLYTPASEMFLNKARGLNLVTDYRALLSQKPVFGLSKSGQKKIKTFADLLKPGIRIALGNPKTMALGKSYLTVEENFQPQTRERIRANMLVKGINVNQIINYVLSNVVDAGITFDTTATANKIAFLEIPDADNVSDTAFLARLNFSNHAEEAHAFRDYIFSQDKIFAKYGFKLNPVYP